MNDRNNVRANVSRADVSARRASRLVLVTTGAALGAVGFMALAGDAVAGPKELRRGNRAAVVGRVETPLGLQGERGAGANVTVPFTLVDPSRRTTDVEVQFGVDVTDANGNSDGVITDDEYVPATEDRLDPRNTRKNRKPQKFVTAGDIGATHAYVWNSSFDIATGRFETLMYQFTDQGRLIPDPDNPGSFLFSNAQAGVKIRIRAVNGSGPSRLVGDWVYSDAFSLNNNTPPSMTIDAVLPNDTSVPTASDEHVSVLWTAIDPDSEDLNGNGVFEPQFGEDVNGNGVRDFEEMGVAFDWYRLAPTDDPSSMTDAELAALVWNECTRVEGEGNTDALPRSNSVPDADRVFGSPNGRQWTFVWDSVADAGTVKDRFILRARPVDKKFENGAHVYLRTPFNLDNRTVFASGGGGADPITGSAARVGATATNLIPGLPRSDPNNIAPFQALLIAGGASSATGSGTSGVDLLLVSTEASETTSSSEPVPLPQFQFSTPRAYHTATTLTDGRVLFAGGVADNGVATSSTEIYDPFTRTMTPGPDLLTARSRHAAVLLSTNQVAFFGGIDANGAVLNSCEVYNFSSFGESLVANTALPNLAVAQHSLHAQLLPDQTVLVAGGVDGAGQAVRTAQLLNPLNDNNTSTPTTKDPAFISIPDMLVGRRFASATSLLDGNVLFAGGAPSGQAAVDSMEVFNWRVRQFESVTVPMPDGGRAKHVGAMLGDGSVLLAGGTANPDSSTASAIGAADLFTLGARSLVGGAPSTPTVGEWTGSFAPVNGGLGTPRHSADAAVIMNGRVMIAGGLTSSNQPTSSVEVFVPASSRNTRPTAYVTLPTSELSWKFGATIHYRVVDLDGDLARIIAQFRSPGGTTWNACSSAASTIGGDIADETASLAVSVQNLTNTDLTIDPVAQNTPGDHVFIWAMDRDIDRPDLNPPTNGRVENYNLRITPYGAVRGVEAITDPVTVLYNTKPITTILPLENRVGAASAGTVNPFQGGDILLWAHVRDIDSLMSPGNGDPCSVAFEYAVDANNDGQILVTSGENWLPMTPSGAAFAGTQNAVDKNVVNGVSSYSEDFSNSSPGFGSRPAGQGWVSFDWDALYDVGPALSTLGYQHRNIWVRVTATDTAEGFPRVLRNRSGGPDEFVYTRHPDGLWMQNWAPRGGNKLSVKANEPIDFTFNGQVDGTSVNANTFKVYRKNGAVDLPVLGTFVTTVTGSTSTITFFPQTQNLNLGANVYSSTGNPTILFSGTDYRFIIPGYSQGVTPQSSVATPTIKPVAVATDKTYLLVNNTSPNGDQDTAQFGFTCGAGRFADGQDVSPSGADHSPTTGGTIADTGGTFSLTYTHAIDASTVQNSTTVPLAVRGATGPTSYVIPGRWNLTNSTDSSGQSSAVLTFVPMFKLPAGTSLTVTSNANLLGTNGTAAGSLGGHTLSVTGGTRVTRTNDSLETFTNTNSLDASGTTAVWGQDACSLGALTGFQDTLTGGTSTTDLTITSTQTYTPPSYPITCRNLTIQKGGKMLIRHTSATSLLINGNAQIDGVIDLAGDEGYTGQHGYSTSYSNSHFQGAVNLTSGVRAGGVGRNGGGTGGESRTSTANSGNNPGQSGFSGSAGSAGGGGGGTGGGTAGSSLGGAGGGGGGHGTAGLTGGAGWYANPTRTAGGFASGDPNMAFGPSAGGGGGGGGMSIYQSSYYQQGGGGGAGAGSLTIVTNGTFTLGSTGLINGRGGQGGSKSHMGGAGGGGAGGGVLIKSGGNVRLDGLIDLRGGNGGPASYGIHSDTYMYTLASTYGCFRDGGNGGSGRLRIEAPNYVAVDQVRVFGGLVIRQITSIPTTSIATSTLPGAFNGTTGTQTVAFGGVSDVRYTGPITVASTAVVDLTNTSGTTTNLPIRIWCDNDITINGVVRANGLQPTTTSQSLLAQDVAGNTYVTSGFINSYDGYAGTLGGGKGGKAMGSSNNVNHQGGDGTGPAPGLHKSYVGMGWNNYYPGSSGGSGGGNASAGGEGWAAYAVSMGYYQPSSATDTTGNGVVPSTRINHGPVGGGVLDAATLNVNTIANFVGSGGGGNGDAGGGSSNWYAIAGRGGGGGGGLVFVTPRNFTLASGARIEARGGDGNPPGYMDFTSASQQPWWTAHPGGGGGSGGTVYVVADNITLATSSVESTTTGATVDVTGGRGGGWRQPITGVQNGYNTYNSGGQFGGQGGYGRLVLEYRTSLNGGRTLVNRWGYEQLSYHDSTQTRRALAGTATFACRGIPGQGAFRSTWYDTGSLRPIMNNVSFQTSSNIGSLTLQGQGAQSHPYNLGTGLTGEPDTANVSALVNTTSAGFLDGWRWFRFSGSFTRGAGSTAPVLDNMVWSYETDQ